MLHRTSRSFSQAVGTQEREGRNRMQKRARLMHPHPLGSLGTGPEDPTSRPDSPPPKSGREYKSGGELTATFWLPLFFSLRPASGQESGASGCFLPEKWQGAQCHFLAATFGLAATFWWQGAGGRVGRWGQAPKTPLPKQRIEWWAVGTGLGPRGGRGRA